MHFITCFDENYLENARRFQSPKPEHLDEKRNVQYLSAAHRTFGYFLDREQAVQAVLRNAGDLHECLYTWCVVETLDEGIHPLGDLENPGANETWFHWNEQTDRWEPVQRPTCFACIAGGFALG